MKKHIVITCLLMVIAIGLLFYCTQTEKSTQNAQMNQAQQYNEVLRLQKQLEEKQAELAGLQGEMDAIAEKSRQNREADEALNTQIRDAEAEIARLNGEKESLQEELAALEAENSYLMEVYHAIEQGYEKLLGYLSDR